MHPARFYEHDGKIHTRTEWARITGINEATLKYRINAGWSVAKALETPVGSIKPVPPSRPVFVPLTPCTIDIDQWLLQVWNDPRRNSSVWLIAGAIYMAVKDGSWPLSVSQLGRAAGMHRRSLQRMLPKLEHCGHVRIDYTHPNRADIILVDKSAPAEPAPLAIAAE